MTMAALTVLYPTASYAITTELKPGMANKVQLKGIRNVKLATGVKIVRYRSRNQESRCNEYCKFV